MSDAQALAKESWDIVIAGGGNAALCAAIEAAEAGAKVLILEGAPKAYRVQRSQAATGESRKHQLLSVADR